MAIVVDSFTLQSRHKQEFATDRVAHYVIDLPRERRTLESVELWYYKDPWGRNPKVNLYSVQSAVPDGEWSAGED